jgi:phage portal protein BeeE
LGVPTQLIGVEGSNTYANYEQANKSFHYQTVIPLLELYLDDMNRWLGAFYPNEKLCFDLEDIPALEVDRKDRREQKIGSKAYSINEIRAEFGDAPRDEIEADYVMTNPSEIPLGLDVFADDEKEEREVAKMLMRKGLSQKEAEQKALDLFHDS